MNTRQIHHFLALLEHGSLSAAADAVHLSQPALSRSIRSLEDALGVPLFDRTDRRLRPTPYARAYAPRARRIALEEREGARLMALMHSGEAGTLAFGMGSSLAPLLLTPIVLELMRAAPRVQLNSVIETSERLLAALLAERLDFFVGDVRVAQDYPELASEGLHHCTFGWFARPGHPLSGKKGIAIETITQYPIVGPGYFEPSLARQFGELYGVPASAQDLFAYTTDDVDTLHAILANSDAVMPATDLGAMPGAGHGALSVLDVTPPLAMELTLGIVRHAGRTLVPASTRAFGIVRERFAEIERQIAVRKGRGKARSR